MQAPNLNQPARRFVVGDAQQAEGLVQEISRAMDALAALLQEESTLLGEGRVRAALALEARKQELAAAYLRGLEAIKANMVALARLVPTRVQDLKAAHAAFRQVVEHNQAVLGTARAVSEGLVRSVAEEMARQARPSVYGRPGPSMARESTGPLLISAHL